MSTECKSDYKLSKEVVEYLKKLSTQLEIKAIILFGSRQKWLQFKHSDYDLFLISDKLPQNFFDRIDMIWYNKPLWVNIIPWRSDEVKKNLHRPFILQILLDGEVIFGDAGEFKKLAVEYVTKNNLKRTKFGFVT